MSNLSVNSVKQWTLFNGMSDEEIERIFEPSENQFYKNGETLCEQGEESDSMFIILYGRVKIQLCKSDGGIQKLNVLSRGDHFGELSLITNGRRNASVIAIMDTSVLKIDKQRFKRLIHDIPVFSFNISNTISSWLQGELSGKTKRHKIGVVGLISCSPQERIFAQQLVEWFCDKEKLVEVFSDSVEAWGEIKQDKYFKRLHTINENSEGAEQTVQKLGLIDRVGKSEHVFLDICLDTNTHPDVIFRLLNQCEHVWLFADQSHQSKLELIFEQLSKEKQNALLSYLQIVWVQAQKPSELIFCKHQIKTQQKDIYCQYELQSLQLREQDLSRIYNKIMGVQIGLALSGGGAKSLAHIGVLSAFEDNQIYFDEIAGTSGGGIISALYAAGYSLQNILDLFEKEMTPPKWIRFIPHSSRWYLMSLFRFGLLDKRFRRYFKDMRLEQLLIPTQLICCDLISGNEVVRSSGNVVDSILESINHPLFGKPILRDGLSLVDGGVLNNLPSSVLRRNKCDFIVSVDVGAKISNSFGGNMSSTRKEDMKQAGYLATLSRVLEMREHGLVENSKNHKDFIIQPDVSLYPFDDFSFGKELYEIGYKAAMEVMPELLQAYHDHIEVD